jgi:4-hydroxyphenylpyruvate dioxygenase
MPMSPMSIATVSLSGALNEKLAAIAAAGFDGVEIFENDLLSFDGTPADVRQAVADLGLRIITFQPFRDFEGMPEPMRTRVFARAERKFELMQALGCDLLLVCSNVSPDSLGGIDRIAADLHELGERAAKRGLRVAYEALAWGRHINDYRDAWEAVRRADHPAVGLVLDSFHTLARGTDLAGMRAIPRDRIFLVQLADAPRLDMDYLSWSRHYRNFPGQGDLPVGDFMRALKATGYDGWISQEIFNDQLRAGSARGVAVDGRRSLIYLEDQLATGNAPRLPPKGKCLGTEFIEFAIDEASAPAFERMLAGRASTRPGCTSRRRWLDGARAASIWWSTPRPRASPTPSTSPTAPASRPSACASTMRRPRSRGPRRCSPSRSARRSARASSTSRRCAASAARWCISSIRRAISAVSGTSSSRRPANRRRMPG